MVEGEEDQAFNENGEVAGDDEDMPALEGGDQSSYSSSSS
jgi:hypothetical protein